MKHIRTGPRYGRRMLQWYYIDQRDMENKLLELRGLMKWERFIRVNYEGRYPEIPPTETMVSIRKKIEVLKLELYNK